MTRLLLDNSVLARLGTPDVYEAVTAFATNMHELCSCMESLAEAGYSAHNAGDFEDLVNRIRYGWLYLESGPMVDAIALDLRRALHGSGTNRAVGAMDVLLAATAIAHRAVVVHYDADFDHLSAAHPEFRSRWIVPRGSVS